MARIDYLNLVEKPYYENFTRFEKVKIASQRAKIIYVDKKADLEKLNHKPTYMAILEINQGKIDPTYVEEESTAFIKKEQLAQRAAEVAEKAAEAAKLATEKD